MSGTVADNSKVVGGWQSLGGCGLSLCGEMNEKDCERERERGREGQGGGEREREREGEREGERDRERAVII